MTSLGSATQLNADISSATSSSVFVSGSVLGPATNGAIPDTDYGFLAGMAGAQIAAAMGSEYEPPTTTPSPSGSFNTKQVVGIIGQQIAAALNQ